MVSGHGQAQFHVDCVSTMVQSAMLIIQQGQWSSQMLLLIIPNSVTFENNFHIQIWSPTALAYLCFCTYWAGNWWLWAHRPKGGPASQPGTRVALPVTLRRWLSSQASAAIRGWPLPLQESLGLPGDHASPTQSDPCPLSTSPAQQSEGMRKRWVWEGSGAKYRSGWFPQHREKLQ